jgi:hypothetical protein
MCIVATYNHIHSYTPLAPLTYKGQPKEGEEPYTPAGVLCHFKHRCDETKEQVHSSKTNLQNGSFALENVSINENYNGKNLSKFFPR